MLEKNLISIVYTIVYELTVYQSPIYYVGTPDSQIGAIWEWIAE